MNVSREQLDAISRRRLEAFSRTGGSSTRDRLTAMADATTLDDLEIMGQAARQLDDFARTVMTLHSDLSQEYARGVRCAVCGRTKAQSEAIAYDCAREC